jgi:hypothetical protein
MLLPASPSRLLAVAQPIGRAGRPSRPSSLHLKGSQRDERRSPRPQVVEIKLGETTTTIGDPELAAALGDLSPEQLRAALHEVLRPNPEQPETGTGREI